MLPLQEESLESCTSSKTLHPNILEITMEKQGGIKMQSIVSGTCLAIALSSIFGEIKIGLGGGESVHCMDLEKYETLLALQFLE